MTTINNTPAFETVTEAIKWLQAKDYVHDFNLDNNCVVYNSGKNKLAVDEFRIDNVFRFEGMTDPGDEDVIYAISSNDGQEKGILFNAFGAYSDPMSEEMIAKLAMRKP